MSAPSDLERLLSQEGRAQARDLGERLARWPKAWRPQLILVSAARRTRETLEQLKGSWPELAAAETLCAEELYLGAPEVWLAHLAPLTGERTVLCVGHNPGLSDLVGALAGSYESLGVAEAVGLTLSGAEGAEGAAALSPWAEAPSRRWRLEGRACGRAAGRAEG